MACSRVIPLFCYGVSTIQELAVIAIQSNPHYCPLINGKKDASASLSRMFSSSYFYYGFWRDFQKMFLYIVQELQRRCQRLASWLAASAPCLACSPSPCRCPSWSTAFPTFTRTSCGEARWPWRGGSGWLRAEATPPRPADATRPPTRRTTYSLNWTEYSKRARASRNAAEDTLPPIISSRPPQIRSIGGGAFFNKVGKAIFFPRYPHINRNNRNSGKGPL